MRRRKWRRRRRKRFSLIRSLNETNKKKRNRRRRRRRIFFINKKEKNCSVCTHSGQEFSVRWDGQTQYRSPVWFMHRTQRKTIFMSIFMCDVHVFIYFCFYVFIYLFLFITCVINESFHLQNPQLNISVFLLLFSPLYFYLFYFN